MIFRLLLAVAIVAATVTPAEAESTVYGANYRARAAQYRGRPIARLLTAPFRAVAAARDTRVARVSAQRAAQSRAFSRYSVQSETYSSGSAGGIASSYQATSYGSTGGSATRVYSRPQRVVSPPVQTVNPRVRPLLRCDGPNCSVSVDSPDPQLRLVAEDWTKPELRLVVEDWPSPAPSLRLVSDAPRLALIAQR